MKLKRRVDYTLHPPFDPERNERILTSEEIEPFKIVRLRLFGKAKNAFRALRAKPEGWTLMKAIYSGPGMHTLCYEKKRGKIRRDPESRMSFGPVGWDD